MQALDTRSTVAELAQDLSWLEDYCRRDPALAAHTGNLHLSSALARNVIGPFLEGQPFEPVHLAVVGGAGAGKSTIVNFLAGAVVAEANPQAGYTRHPTAFMPASLAEEWPSYLGFLGSLHRISVEQPANLDEDIYQVKQLPEKPNGTESPLGKFVIWDCPDMTTQASVGYVARLLEVAALADIIVYVASDERYNDVVPTQYLHLLVKAGKAVVVVLTKMREVDAAPMIEHFRQEVLGQFPRLPDGSVPAVPVIAFPQMPQAVRADPAGAGAKYRVQLLNQVLIQSESARLRTTANAMKYLSETGSGLLKMAKRDIEEFEAWNTAVMAGKNEFERRYQREFLEGEQFVRFDRYRDDLLEMVELPGAGRMWGNVLWILRSPYRWGRRYLTDVIVRPEVRNLSETTVLSAALSAWLDQLQAESLQRDRNHPVWKAVIDGFDSGLARQARDRFQKEMRPFELQEIDDIEKVGRAMIDTLAKHPPVLYALRIAKVSADAIVVLGVIVVTWVPVWYQLLLIPLGLSATHQAAELVARGATETARSRVRAHRGALVASSLANPMAAWLSSWPATGGTSFAQLQSVMRRVPAAIKMLEQGVAAKLNESQRAPETVQA